MQGLLQTVPRGGDGGTDGHGVGAGGSDRCYMMLALHLALAGGSLAAAPAPRPPLALALGCQLPRRAAPSASTPPAAPTTDLAARRAAPPGPCKAVSYGGVLRPASSSSCLFGAPVAEHLRDYAFILYCYLYIH